MSAEQIGLDRPHVFQPADDAAAGPPLLLLHGTGGDEHDLLPLRDHLSPWCGRAFGTRNCSGERHAAVLPPAARGCFR